MKKVRIPRKLKVYLACALTHAPAEHRAQVELLRKELKKDSRIEILDFYSLGGGTKVDVDVYEWDIHRCVKNANVIIAECSYPSTGLGWELGTAVEKYRIPVWMFASATILQTRLVTGAANSRHNPILTYDLYDGQILNIIPAINKKLNGLRKDRID